MWIYPRLTGELADLGANVPTADEQLLITNLQGIEINGNHAS